MTFSNIYTYHVNYKTLLRNNIGFIRAIHLFEDLSKEINKKIGINFNNIFIT